MTEKRAAKAGFFTSFVLKSRFPMNERRMAKADFFTSIVLMAFGISAAVMALQMPKDYGMGGGQSPHSAPGLLPVILGVVIAGLSFIMFVRSLIRTGGAVGVSGASLKEVFTETGTLRVIATIIICLCYVFLLGKVWYPLLTFLFVFVFAAFFEYDRKTPFRAQIKKLLFALLLALVTSAAVTAVFQYLFFVRLP
ncbi:MAG: tripartite tricarboxylate transporter TctB family protein [Treponema sp.]|jgi:hypothetical protein|nr:tripartite tricarboxylate transporter TctB family protein [Treponema sp.]